MSQYIGTSRERRSFDIHRDTGIIIISITIIVVYLNKCIFTVCRLGGRSRSSALHRRTVYSGANNKHTRYILYNYSYIYVYV